MEKYTENQPCNAQPLSPLPKDPVLAMAYVPFQKFEDLYAPETAFENGTLFSGLNKPFLGGAK